VDSIRIKGIDVNIQLVFQAEHIKLITPLFQKAGLPKTVSDDIIDFYIKSGEVVSYERFFLEYGQEVLNPILNQLLVRHPDHPTFNNILKHGLKEVLENSELLKAFKKV
jgi:hypothetical protein